MLNNAESANKRRHNSVRDAPEECHQVPSEDRHRVTETERERTTAEAYYAIVRRSRRRTTFGGRRLAQLMQKYTEKTFVKRRRLLKLSSGAFLLDSDRIRN